MRQELTVRRVALHILLTGCLFLWPLLSFNSAIPFTSLVLGCLIAYEGAQNISILRWTGLLVIIELVYAMDFGILSLSFALTVAIFALAGHWLNLKPWASERGWELSIFIRTLVSSLVASVTVSAISVIIGSLAHGHTQFWERFEMSFGDWQRLGLSLLVILLLIIIMRRADQPFRQKITFGI